MTRGHLKVHRQKGNEVQRGFRVTARIGSWNYTQISSSCSSNYFMILHELVTDFPIFAQYLELIRVVSWFPRYILFSNSVQYHIGILYGCLLCSTTAAVYTVNFFYIYFRDPIFSRLRLQPRDEKWFAKRSIFTETEIWNLFLLHFCKNLHYIITL